MICKHLFWGGSGISVEQNSDGVVYLGLIVQMCMELTFVHVGTRIGKFASGHCKKGFKQDIHFKKLVKLVQLASELEDISFMAG